MTYPYDVNAAHVR